MKWPMWIGMVLVLTIGTGCGGDGGGASIDTPAQIETSIGDGCKKQVVRDPFPKDGGHERFRSLAQNAHLIRCADSYKLWSDANLSAYARFASHPQLMKAIASIKLPPARYEHFCLTDREAFTTEFFGSSPVCKALGG